MCESSSEKMRYNGPIMDGAGSIGHARQLHGTHYGVGPRLYVLLPPPGSSDTPFGTLDGMRLQ